MSRILITDFGDWAGSTANPSKAVAEALGGTSIAGADINTVIAENIFEEMVGVVTSEIDRITPESVIRLGEFCGRSMITVERLAQNLAVAAVVENEKDIEEPIRSQWQ